MLKLETNGESDYFVGFNRAAGINSDVVQAGNRVTVYQVQDGDGMKYSTSSLKGSLGSGNRMVVDGWRSTALDLVIVVNEINTSASPGYADVEITFGPQGTRGPTKSPTQGPTKSPTSVSRTERCRTL